MEKLFPNSAYRSENTIKLLKDYALVRILVCSIFIEDRISLKSTLNDLFLQLAFESWCQKCAQECSCYKLPQGRAFWHAI